VISVKSNRRFTWCFFCFDQASQTSLLHEFRVKRLQSLLVNAWLSTYYYSVVKSNKWCFSMHIFQFSVSPALPCLISVKKIMHTYLLLLLLLTFSIFCWPDYRKINVHSNVCLSRFYCISRLGFICLAKLPRYTQIKPTAHFNACFPIGSSASLNYRH